MTTSGSEYIAETIVALATPPGRGGVGIIRISGPDVYKVAKSMLGHIPEHRKAEFLKFNDSSGNRFYNQMLYFNI